MRRREVRRGWIALVLTGCAAGVGAPPVVIAPEASAAPVEDEVQADPALVYWPEPPCPQPGWATPAALVGGWNLEYGFGGRGGVGMVAERHDYRADGSVTSVRLTRRFLRPEESEALVGYRYSGIMPPREVREEMRGTWSVDDSGVREVRWTLGAKTRVMRERVWVMVGSEGRPRARTEPRPLVRGSDGVWRGEVFVEESEGGRVRGYESRLELRFEPPLDEVAGERCTVEVARQLRVWGEGEPEAWRHRAQSSCTVGPEGIELGEPGSRIGAVPPERFAAAYAEFDFDGFFQAAPDVLVPAIHNVRREPTWQARRADPPFWWYEVKGRGFCRPVREEDGPRAMSQSSWLATKSAATAAGVSMNKRPCRNGHGLC